MIGLNELIRETIADNPESDDEEIALLVKEATPRNRVGEFYIKALTRYVADFPRKSRNSTLNSPVGKKGNARSYTREEIGAWHEKLMNEKVPSADGKKLLGDCTIDDLEYVIEKRENLIDRVGEQIRKYRTIMAAMRKHGVLTVRELPIDAVKL